MPPARECVITNRFPNGDFRRSRDDATNEVIASSRGHDKLRVENTIAFSATATGGSDRIVIAAGGIIPGPSTGFEVFVPGRQGIRACRDSNPACGSADLLGTPSAVSLLSQVPSRGVAAQAAWFDKLPGPPPRPSCRAKPECGPGQLHPLVRCGLTPKEP